MPFIRSVAISLTTGLILVACSDSGDTKSSRRTTRPSSGHAARYLPTQTPISGAIFTTDPTGNRVNANIYAAKTDVHLNGGPARPGAAAGLPDGDYYYQITDPGCKELLAGPNPTTTSIPKTASKHITVVDGETDPVLTQLAPFNDTPNPGGEYKVWIIPVELYAPTARNTCFGFIPRYSKTDNFKVRAPGTHCISGRKWFDEDYDGHHDSEDTQPVAGFKIRLSNAITATTYTDQNGFYAFCNLQNGSYTVSEVIPPANGISRWIQTFPSSLTHAVTIADADVSGMDFGNSCIVNGRYPNVPCTVPEY